MPIPPEDPVRRKTWLWSVLVMVFSSSYAHLVFHGTDPVVVLENFKSCGSGVSGSILVQEGLSVLAVLAMVITDERIGHCDGCDDGG
jgi:hypothetical protein